MAKAGLTVGGFYAHFTSKDELADEAVRSALTERRKLFLRRFDGLSWEDRTCCAIRGYFTKEHRDDPAHGCPLSMAALEATQNPSINGAFSKELALFAEALQNGKGHDGPTAPREIALGTLALMVGGMILARATKGHPISGEILEAAISLGTGAVRTGPAEIPTKRRSKQQGGLR